MKFTQALKEWHKQIKLGQVVEVEVLPESFWHIGLKKTKKFPLTVTGAILQHNGSVLNLFGEFTHPDSGRVFQLCITITSTLEQFNAVSKHWTGYIVRKISKTQCAASAES